MPQEERKLTRLLDNLQCVADKRNSNVQKYLIDKHLETLKHQFSSHNNLMNHANEVYNRLNKLYTYLLNDCKPGPIEYFLEDDSFKLKCKLKKMISLSQNAFLALNKNHGSLSYYCKTLLADLKINIQLANDGNANPFINKLIEKIDEQARQIESIRHRPTN